MNDTAKTFMNSKASSSGMHSRVATNAADTASIDEEFSAFFDQGDAGDYVGGFRESPLSVDPVTYDETREEHPVVKSSGRRVFFAKVVTVIVAGCATLMMVAVSLKSLPSQAHARQVANMAEAAQNRETLSPAAPEIATPNREIGAVAPAVRPELPRGVQQEPTVTQPVAADAPQVASMPAVQEPTIEEPGAANAPQVAAVPAAKSGNPPEAVPIKSSNPSLRTVKSIRDVQPVKISLARSSTKNRRLSQAPIRSAMSVRSSSVAGSKPSVVAFPVD